MISPVVSAQSPTHTALCVTSGSRTHTTVWDLQGKGHSAPIAARMGASARRLTFFRESPCRSWMYFRKAVVHCRVVALSVSALQNGTKRFSSSQQMRILRLCGKTRRDHTEDRPPSKGWRLGTWHRGLGQGLPSSQDPEHTTVLGRAPSLEAPAASGALPRSFPICFSEAEYKCPDQGWSQTPEVGRKCCVWFFWAACPYVPRTRIPSLASPGAWLKEETQAISETTRIMARATTGPSVALTRVCSDGQSPTEADAWTT